MKQHIERKVFYTLFTLLSIFMNAQMVSIGNGTEKEKLPIYPYMPYNYSQSIYLSSEIGQSGNIEKITFKGICDNPFGQTCDFDLVGAGSDANQWKVYIGMTEKTAFSNTNDYITDNLQLVFDGTVTPTNENKIDILLSTPFVYDNTKNLIIAVYEGEYSEDLTSEQKFFCTSVNTNRSIKKQEDMSIDDINSPGEGELVDKIPNIDIHFQTSTTSCSQEINIPDDNFKTALLQHGTTISANGVSVIDTDGDGKICQDEAEAYTGVIYAPAKNISDLTGIEAFKNAIQINVGNNNLTSLDISENTALEVLRCQKNDIATLNLASNTALKSLICQDNNLSSLDVSNNTQLTKIWCFKNQITDLDISSNTLVTDFRAKENALTSLNIANGNNANMTKMKANENPNLTCIKVDNGFTPTNENCSLYASGWCKDNTAEYNANCSSTNCTEIISFPDNNFKQALLQHGTGISINGVSVIDTDGDGEICTTEAQAYTGTIFVQGKNITTLEGIAYFTNATALHCGNNQLTSLDVSSCSSLIQVGCAQNFQLTSLNVANGNNANFTMMSAMYNVNLTCIQHDEGFNPSTASGWYKEPSANYSSNCTMGVDDIITDDKAINVYPNPFTDTLYIHDIKGVKTIQLINMNGQLVKTFKAQKVLSIPKLTVGVYFIKISYENGSEKSVKVIKDK